MSMRYKDNYFESLQPADDYVANHFNKKKQKDSKYNGNNNVYGLILVVCRICDYSLPLPSPCKA